MSGKKYNLKVDVSDNPPKSNTKGPKNLLESINMPDVKKIVDEMILKYHESVEKRIDELYKIMESDNKNVENIPSPMEVYNSLLTFYNLPTNIGTYREMKEIIESKVIDADHKYFLIRAYKDRKPIDTYHNIITKKSIPKIEN